jgi:hypothetical protein
MIDENVEDAFVEAFLIEHIASRGEEINQECFDKAIAACKSNVADACILYDIFKLAKEKS